MPREVIPDEPIWKPYANIGTAKTAGQYGLTALLMFYLFFGVLRPLIKKATSDIRAPAVQTVTFNQAEPASVSVPQPGYDSDLLTAKQLAAQEPKVVANVVKNWVNGNE
jgi:flagellar M-ring protein FliF